MAELDRRGTGLLLLLTFTLWQILGAGIFHLFSQILNDS